MDVPRIRPLNILKPSREQEKIKLRQLTCLEKDNPEADPDLLAPCATPSADILLAMEKYGLAAAVGIDE
jgi:hypothetical protein